MRRRVVAGILAAGVAAGAMLVAGLWPERGASSFPRTSFEAGDGDVAFVSDDSCGSCHAVEQAAWVGSHHARAMQPATDTTVAGDFDDTTFTEHGVTTRFRRRGDRFLVEAEGPLGAMEEYEVLYTFGVEPMQQYLVALPGGRLHALSIAWDTQRDAWFSLLPGERVPPGDARHWTGRLQRWNDRCAECHSTDLRVAYDADADEYRTTWAAVSVGCQACHGPGERHVAWARSGDAPDEANEDTPAARYGLVVDAKNVSHGAEVMRCARCHSRRGRASGEDAHGRDYFDDFELSLLREGLYHPDGQIRDEVYVTGSFLQSAMHRRGVTCGDCHDPHTGGTLVQGNGLCTRCHRTDPPAAFPTLQARAYDTPEHHRHEPNTAGATCVECHMPAQTYMEVDARRDHSLRVPRPDLSEQLGTPNACTQCHTDRSDAWAADAVRAWYGSAQRPVHYGEIIAAGRSGEPGAARQLATLAADTGRPGIVRATAVELLASYGADAVTDAAVTATGDADPLVRLAGVNALAHADSAARSETLPRLLTDPVVAVRSAAARVLAPFAAELTDPAQQSAFDAALDAFRRAQLAQADQPEAHHNLGDLDIALGRADAAEQSYARALALDSTFVPAHVNLAVLYNRVGRNAEAERLLRRAMTLAPELDELHYSLGLLLAETGRMGAAVQELALAAVAPGLSARPRVHYNHGLALQQVGSMQAAEAALLRAFELAPDDPTFVIGLAFHYRATAQWDQAEQYARALIELQPDEPGPQRLLDRIRTERQQR